MPFGWGKKSGPGALDTGALDAFDRALPGDPGSIGPASGWTEADTRALLGREMPLLTAFLAERACSSVGGGALRFLLPQTSPSLTGWNGPSGWRSSWPSKQPGAVFATDWLGRLYLVLRDLDRPDGEPALGWLDTGTGELIRLGQSFPEMLRFLAKDWRGLTDADRLDEWRRAGNPTPGFGQVVAPAAPLFLGGSDAIPEMRLSDLEVEVALNGQLWEQVKGLPPGTPISGVSAG